MPILTPPERLGQKVAGRYRLESILSSGGMGVLFRAVDDVSGERVAVKMLKPTRSLEPASVDRFARETRIAASLRHENIAEVREVWRDDEGIPFLLMELLDGVSLEKELEEREVLPFEEVLEIVLPVLRALGAAHRAGVVHRDVKPGNIFLSRDSAGRRVPKLLDFGIAKTCAEEFETETGVVVGTPGYMAPEQAQYGECGAFTDIWAVGAVIFRCVTGEAPHASPSVTEALGKLVRQPVPSLRIPGFRRSVGATVDRALALDPGARYESANAFAAALVTAVADRASESTQETAACGPATPARPGGDVGPESAGGVAVARVEREEREEREERTLGAATIEAKATRGRPGFPVRAAARTVALVAAGALIGMALIGFRSPPPPPARAAEPAAREEPARAVAAPVVARDEASTLLAGVPPPLEPPATARVEPRQGRQSGAPTAPKGASAGSARAAPRGAGRASVEVERGTGLPVANEW